MAAALKHKEQSHTDGNTLKTITQIRQNRKTGTNKKGTIKTENQNGLEKRTNLNTIGGNDFPQCSIEA